MTTHNKSESLTSRNFPNQSFDLSFDRPVMSSAERAPRTKSPEPNRNTRDGIRNTRFGRLILGGAIVGLAASAYLGYEAAKDEPRPQPEKTGVMVNIYPQQGEGENQLMQDLARPGVDSDQLRTAVEATEDDEGRLVQGPIPVDTGFLTTDQDVLLQYGVQPQELNPTQ